MFRKKDPHKSIGIGSDADKLSGIISVLEGGIEREEQMFDGLYQIQCKLASIEKFKEEARKQVEMERENIKQLYFYEKYKADEIAKEIEKENEEKKAKEKEAENEIEEYKRNLKKESDALLEAEINKMKARYEEENAQLSKIIKASKEDENRTKENYEDINAKVLDVYNKMQEEMTAFKSTYEEFNAKKDASPELMQSLNNAENISSMESLTLDWNNNSNDEDYGMLLEKMEMLNPHQIEDSFAVNDHEMPLKAMHSPQLESNADIESSLLDWSTNSYVENYGMPLNEIPNSELEGDIKSNKDYGMLLKEMEALNTRPIEDNVNNESYRMLSEEMAMLSPNQPEDDGKTSNHEVLLKEIGDLHLAEQDAPHEMAKPLNNVENINDTEDWSFDWNNTLNDDKGAHFKEMPEYKSGSDIKSNDNYEMPIKEMEMLSSHQLEGAVENGDDYEKFLKEMLNPRSESDDNIVPFDRADELHSNEPIDVLSKLQEARRKVLSELSPTAESYNSGTRSLYTK